MADNVIELPRLELRKLEVVIIGDSPLITHAWSEKSKQMMRDKQQKKASTGRAAKEPKKEFEASIHHMPGGGCGFPSVGFKAAAIIACTSIPGITKIAARQAFHIQGELVRIEGCKPKMREDMVRIGMGVADLRYRAEFFPWFARLPITYNTKALSVDQIINLLNTAGFGVGIGEWRPGRDGQYGRFHCADSDEMKLITKKSRRLAAE